MLLFGVGFFKFEQKQLGRKCEGEKNCVERQLSSKDLIKSIGNKSFPSQVALHCLFP